MEETISVRYSGKQIEELGGMDAEDVAHAIDGLSDFIRALSEVTYGDQPDLKLSIQGFKSGSLEINFILDIATTAATLAASFGPKDLFDAVKQAIELLKHLGGQAPKSTKQASHGGVAVENNSGKIQVYNGPVVNLVINGGLGPSSERFARRPLSNEADKMMLKVGRKIAGEAKRENADDFTSKGVPESIGDFTAEQHLTIQTLILEGDGAWRFSDGQNKFKAEITDENFLRRVREGRERFGRGDILKVRLKSSQEIVRGQLKTKHTIEKVIDHKPFQKDQMELI